MKSSRSPGRPSPLSGSRPRHRSTSEHGGACASDRAARLTATGSATTETALSRRPRRRRRGVRIRMPVPPQLRRNWHTRRATFRRRPRAGSGDRRLGPIGPWRFRPGLVCWLVWSGRAWSRVVISTRRPRGRAPAAGPDGLGVRGMRSGSRTDGSRFGYRLLPVSGSSLVFGGSAAITRAARDTESGGIDAEIPRCAHAPRRSAACARSQNRTPEAPP